MLKDDFFTIKGKESSGDGQVTYHVELNADHAIFKGHFPGNPISPGVCNIGMIKACAEEEIGASLFIGNMKQVKFSHLITPTENKELDIELKIDATDSEAIKLVAAIVKDGTKFMDIKAEARKE
ncbi:MAG: hypothetical protein MJZ23_04420 [Paludibacteraceae bacterium]|nr:hypothetical protein [Paludibacteraceae bacterium]